MQTGGSFDRHRFAREHRLVEQHVSRSQLGVRRDHAAERELDDIPRNEPVGRERGPGAVTADGGGHCQPRLQGFQGLLGAAFLDQPDDRVEQQQAGDDSCLGIFAKRQFQDDRGFEHPGHRRPEFFEGTLPRMQHGVGHGVGAELREPALRLFAGQTIGVDEGCRRGAIMCDRDIHALWCP